MKNIVKSGILALITFFALAACNPQENSDYSLGASEPISVDQIAYTKTVSPKSANVFTFACTTDLDIPFSVLWDLGNGKTTKSKTVTGEYPLRGDYTVTLTVYTADGVATSKSEVLRITNDDFSLINTPAYRNLTGGMENAAGKTWVFDQYNNFTKEVAKATGKDIKGHMGLGNAGNSDQQHWGAEPDAKKDWKMYDFKFTFQQEGVKLKIQNAGEGYGRKATAASIGKFNVTSTSGDDAIFDYSGGNYTFSLEEKEGSNPTLTLSGNAFMGYYCGKQEYEIIYQTDKVMALCTSRTTEGHDWVFIYCLKELNTSTPPIVKTPQAVLLTENFEKEAVVSFVTEEMGTMSGLVDNPAPVPVNESAKVYRYQKSSASFYSNMSFTAATYTFDLSKQNKIKMKVFIPSYNDYTKEHDVAGDWIANKKLLPQLAVKLQDSTKGGDAWQTQTEITKTDLVKDKWIELVFDFSSVSDRTDYDKIVIQFGGEGHNAPGFFFFDDFSFGE